MIDFLIYFDKHKWWFSFKNIKHCGNVVALGTTVLMIVKVTCVLFEKLGQSAHKVLQPRLSAYVYVSDVIAYLDNLKVESFNNAFSCKQTVIKTTNKSLSWQLFLSRDNLCCRLSFSRFFWHVKSRIIWLSQNTCLF